MDAWIAIAGWSGALLVLAQTCLALFARWKPKETRYMVVGIVASSLLTANAALTGAWPFLCVNVMMILTIAYCLLLKPNE